MKILSGTILPLFLLTLSALFLAACGANSARQLQSITLTPSAAKAAGADGTVQFVATGHYNQEPYEVSPLEATWSFTSSSGQQIALKQDGQASCKAGQTGTVTVAAWIQSNPGGPICEVIGPGGAP